MSRTPRRRSRRNRRDRGSVAVEIAVVYPVVLLLILGAVQFGVWWYASHVAHAVADAGLAAARADGATEQQAELAAVGLLEQLGGDGLLGNVTVEVERDDLQASVTVEGEVVPVIPGLSLPVSVELSGPTDRFTPDSGG